jgi:preprotein translocase subunit SecG
MYGLLLTLFILVCVFQMIAILLQSSKGGGLAGAFGGGGGMGAVFGGRGAATFLSKLTSVLAALFMLLALLLGILETGRSSGGDSLVAKARQEQQAATPSPAQNLPSIPATGPATTPQNQQPTK